MAKSKLTGTYGNVSEPVFFWTSTFKQSHIPWSNASVIGVWASRVSWSVCSTVRNVIFIRAACLLWLLEPAVCFLAAVFYPEIISSDFLVDSLKLFIYEFLKCKSDLSLESIAFGNFMDLERRRTRKTSTKKQVAWRSLTGSRENTENGGRNTVW